MLINSLQNPKIKHAIHLRKKNYRNREGQIIIEGFEEISTAYNNKINIHTIFYCSEFFEEQLQFDFLQKIQKSNRNNLLIETSKDVFEKMAYRENPDGWIAISDRIQYTLGDIKFKNLPFVVIGESIEKPGNLGTILRTSDAVNADGVIVTDPTIDINNPNVIRASVGTIFTTLPCESDNETTFKWLRENNISIYGAVPDATIEYTEMDFTKPTAIVVGTEKTGLTDFWLKNCDKLIKIPMLGSVNSLNVAAATAVILYEVVRQRRK